MSNTFETLETIIAQSGVAMFQALQNVNASKDASKIAKEAGARAFSAVVNECLNLALTQGVNVIDRDVVLPTSNEQYTIKKLSQSFFPQLNSLIVQIIARDANERAILKSACDLLVSSIHTQVSSLSGAVRACLAKNPSNDAKASLEHARALSLGFTSALHMQEMSLAIVKACEGLKTSKAWQEAKEIENARPDVATIAQSTREALLKAIAFNDWASALELLAKLEQEQNALDTFNASSEQERNAQKAKEAQERQNARQAQKADIEAQSATVAAQQAAKSAKAKQERAKALKALAA